MRHVIALVMATGLLGTGGSGQEPAPGSPLRTLVDTERAFSRMSVEQGTREAFIAFFADDGVSFNPAPVNAKKVMATRKASAGQTSPVLAWEPLTGDVAAAGDLGYSTGPFPVTDGTATKNPLRQGWFFTIWRKQADGTWKAAADIGIRTPPHVYPPNEPFRAVTTEPRSGKAARTDLSGGEAMVLELERALSETAATGGTVEAMRPAAHADIRMHCEGRAPMVGWPAVSAYLASERVWMSWTPLKAGASRSGDLGYVYGKYSSRQAAAAPVAEQGYYLRVWKRVGDEWRIVADITNPEPPGTEAG